MSSQLSIKDIRVLTVHFTIGPASGDSSKNAEQGEAKAQFGFSSDNIEWNEEGCLIKVKQSVTLNDSKPFSFSLFLEIGGIFLLNPKPESEELDRFVKINCNAILFPYLRENVSDICRRGGMAPIFLPPINFVKLYQDGVFNKEDGNTS